MEQENVHEQSVTGDNSNTRISDARLYSFFEVTCREERGVVCLIRRAVGASIVGEVV